MSINECVILLHGLARTSSSMNKMKKALLAHGYQVINYDYPSRKMAIEKLSSSIFPDILCLCKKKEEISKLHFVTHSLGGILVRYYLEKSFIPNLGRVVMLSPPNRGSEVVDKLRNVPGFKLLNGPAGQQLGTDNNSIPRSLGAPNYEVGIITGDRSVNLILSQLIPGKNDGKVSVESAKLEGMKDFLITHNSHPFIMRNEYVIEETIYFLKNGKFSRK